MVTRLLDRLQERIENPALQTDVTDVIVPEIAAVVTADVLADAEMALGFPLIPLLRSMYLEIGNGGFGPGYGFFALPDETTQEGDGSLVEVYWFFRQEDPEYPMYRWPDRLVPICSWGCGIYSCIDCSSCDGPILRFDPDAPQERAASGFTFRSESDSLEAWLTAWVDGVDLWKRMFPD